MYRALIKNEVVPALGRMKVAAVGFEDVDRLHRNVSRRAPYLANRLLALLSKMFALSVLWNMRGNSPVRGVQRNQEIKRKRYLSGDELARLPAYSPPISLEIGAMPGRAGTGKNKFGAAAALADLGKQLPRRSA